MKNKIFTPVKKQLQDHFKALVFIVLSAGFLVSTLLLISSVLDEPLRVFTRDPVAMGRMELYTGYFSQMGAILWFSTAGLIFFTFLNTTHKFKYFLLFSGFFTLFLGLDDLFMVHEAWFRRYSGLPEEVFYALYIFLMLFYFLKFFAIIKQTPYILLLMAFGSFGISVICDPMHIQGMLYVFEDGFKMLGIISWMTYHYLVASNMLSDNI